MRKAASLMLVLFCLLMVPGCKSSQSSKIAGKWVCKSTGDKMELSENHTSVVYSMDFHYPGRWSVSGPNIKVEAGQIVLTGTFDGKNIEAVDAIMHNKYVFEKVGETKG